MASAMKWNVVIPRGLLAAGCVAWVMAMTGCAVPSGGGRPAAEAADADAGDAVQATPEAPDKVPAPAVSAQKTPPPAAASVPVEADASSTNVAASGDHLLVANRGFVPAPYKPAQVASEKPLVFSNARGVDVDQYVKALSGDVKALLDLSREGRPDAIAPAAATSAAVAPTNLESIVQRLDDKLTKDIGEGQGGLRPYIAKASLCLFDSDCRLQEEDMAGLSPDDRALVDEYRRLFTQLGEQMGRDQGADREILASSAGTLVQALEARKPLRIREAVLCSEISGYGAYQPLPQLEFKVGAYPLVMLYTELANFKTSPLPDGTQAVKLVQELSLHRVTPAGLVLVWSELPAQVTDISRTARRDFFLGQVVRLPEPLDPGEYELKVKVLDLADTVSATASISLRIVAGP